MRCSAAVVMKSCVFCDILPCSPLESFRGKCRLDLHGQARNQCEVGSKQILHDIEVCSQSITISKFNTPSALSITIKLKPKERVFVGCLRTLFRTEII
jgi:hypothetical protein